MMIEEAIKDITENIQPSVGGKSLEMAIAALRGECLTCTEINIEEAIEGFKMDNALLCEKQADIIARNNLAIEYLEKSNEVEE